MNREKRRVLAAKRMATLAEIRQNAAMRGLADALAEEMRSAGLAERSRALVQSYSGRSAPPDGAALHHAVGFAGALATLATDAEAARSDAGQQAQWAAEALSEAQTRAQRQGERLESALAAYRSVRERRENEGEQTKAKRSAPSLARLMQSDGDSQDPVKLRPPRTSS